MNTLSAQPFRNNFTAGAQRLLSEYFRTARFSKFKVAHTYPSFNFTGSEYHTLELFGLFYRKSAALLYFL